MTPDQLAKFKIRYTINELNCWIWHGIFRKSSIIHPALTDGNTKLLARRLSYDHYIGDILPGFFVCPCVLNIKCVNPEHLSVDSEYFKLKESIQQNNRRSLCKTHCRNGHVYSETGYYIPSDGIKRCKKCKDILRVKNAEQIKLYGKKYRARKKQNRQLPI